MNRKPVGKMAGLLGRTVEESFPFLAYLCVKRKSDLLLGAGNDDLLRDLTKTYSALPIEQLEALHLDEVKRATALDDKTFRFGTSFGTALTIASTGTTFLAQSLPFGFKIVIVVFSLAAACYSAIGGFLGLSAARTLKTYGVGTSAAVEALLADDVHKPAILAERIVYQEKINIVRVAKNEASFLCIRNGALFVIFSVAIMLIASLFIDGKDAAPTPKLWQTACCAG